MGKKLQLDELGQLGQSGQNVSLPCELANYLAHSMGKN